MKFWSIITLMIFLNFTALPGIAAIVSWELPQTNVMINEEETHHSTAFVVYEKVIPKTLDINDFLKFCEIDHSGKKILKRESVSYLSPLLSIFSPPPEAI